MERWFGLITDRTEGAEVIVDKVRRRKELSETAHQLPFRPEALFGESNLHGMIGKRKSLKQAGSWVAFGTRL